MVGLALLHCCSVDAFAVQLVKCLSIVSPLADLHHIRLPPPPGVSQELHSFMREVNFS